MQRIFFLLPIFLFFLRDVGFSQSGCKDPLALNYDPWAITNDGSCIFEETYYNAEKLTRLDDKVEECSGLIWVSGELWSLNDSGNAPELYQIDTSSGAVLKTLKILNYPNVDWEDLAKDEHHIYIGDFGNNKGNRKDLSVGRLKIEDLHKEEAEVDIIRFSMADQKSFNLPKQGHDFDIEAFFVQDSFLYFFTKNWADGKTRVYQSSTLPGEYALMPIDSFEIGGIATAADIIGDSLAVILGYTQQGRVWMYVLSDFLPGKFFSGNKRLLELGTALRMGQAEAICFNNEKQGFIGAEKFKIVNQQIFSFDLKEFFPSIQHSLKMPESFGQVLVKGNNGLEINLSEVEHEVKKVQLVSGEGEILIEQDNPGREQIKVVVNEMEGKTFFLRLQIGGNIYIQKI
jgi:hypothetical protein